MKILILSQYHYPEIGAAATRWGEYSRYLVEQGHDVTVLSELPNYPWGIVQKPFKNRWVQTDRIRCKTDPNIVRSWVWVNHRKTTFQRLGFFLSFMVSSITVGIRLPRPDLIITSSPPLFVGVTGVILAKWFSVPMVLDIRDIWPHSAIELGELKSTLLITFAGRLMRFIYHRSRGFLLAVPGFSRHLESEGIPESKPRVNLINGISDSFMQQCEGIKKHNSNNSIIRIVYAGNIGLAQGLDTVLQAAKELGEQFEFRIIGDGVHKEKVAQLKDSLGLQNVELLPPMSRERLVRELRMAQIGLVPLKDIPLFRHAIPSKTFEYLAAGLYVICMFRGEIEPFIEDSGGGLCIPSEDVNSLVKALRSTIDIEFVTLAQKSQRYVKQFLMKRNLLDEAIQKIESTL